MAAAAKPGRKPIGLILSYVFDWIIIILMVVVGATLQLLQGNRRAFSLADPDISFPYAEHETISTMTLVLVALVAPAVITLAISLLLVPGPTVSKNVPKSLIWKRKLWEWNTAWLGLATALALSFLFTQGMKNMFGRPRPDLLSRCKPDLANAAKYTVGGFGNNVTQGQYLVDWHICTQKDDAILKDGFLSFPSGHSSFSWAGMLYLTLFLCSKFAIAIPYLLPASYSSIAFASRAQKATTGTVGQTGEEAAKDELATQTISQERVLRSSAAAPPTYLIVVAIIPIGAAIYIVSTRFSDYRHHGFDILFGSFIGIVSAYVGFRWYHAPIRRGAGWSWGPRSKERAWGIGVGLQGYAGSMEHKRNDDLDVEQGNGFVTPPTVEPNGTTHEENR